MKQLGSNTDATCLVCGEGDTRIRRGLCVKHYERFLRSKQLLKPDAAMTWEEQLIKAGKLAPKRQGKRLSQDEDVFADLLASFVAKHPGAFRSSDDVSPVQSSEEDESRAFADEALNKHRQMEAKKSTSKKPAKGGRTRKQG